jgi:hypothetical protein
MKVTSVLALSLLATFAGCSSKSEQDRGLEGTGVGSASSAPDTNPEGVPYPTDNIGTIARRGATPGNRIANFKFLGYPDGDVARGLTPLSLANFYDPAGTKYRIIHIQASGTWCTACQAETQTVVPMKGVLEAKKAIWLVSLAEGPTPGTPSTQRDLDLWITKFKSPYTHWLDPNNANLGPFYDRSALPWNANIDAKTMEILTSGTGAVTTSEGIEQEIDEALEAANASALKAPTQ